LIVPETQLAKILRRKDKRGTSLQRAILSQTDQQKADEDNLRKAGVRAEE
jgi:hypothetical protein